MNSRMLVSVLAACSLLGFSALPVSAASKSGDDLAGQCQVGSSLAIIVCHIYIHAVSDVLETDSVAGRRACIPTIADIDQSVNIVVDWLKEHPAEGQKSASGVVAKALSATYPCK